MSPSPQGSKKILLVSNNAAFADNLKKALEKEGYVVPFSAKGDDGFAALHNTLPHLVIIDIVIEGMDAYTFLEHKQAESLLSKIPVFLISTQGAPITMHRVPEGSVKEFILAPENSVEHIVSRAHQYIQDLGTQGSNSAPAEPAKKTILWVEDDKLIGSILGRKLITSGFDLIHAKTGDEALKHLEQTIPHIIVVDLLLPGMNGFEILQRIRADIRLKNVPIMVLSNLSKPTDIERTKDLGAQKFLVKATASLDQIVHEVENLIAISKT